ncbi:HAD-superfamily hydrolase, subfamily IIB [Spirochaeta africana DSM 8902]|uniref:HAD-superfamily hydrolase, subfamily IIB n=2 Tax=Spirochaeta TaxID=146 RepID=H9UFH6_SPIAZ|nr:HAD-superfamily hydrolase, subfamily IIB [Spirochaeta africana DSM 8902]
MIALDLDDTLLDHDQLISVENHDALVAAEQRGIRIVLASGRSPFGMQPYLAQLELHQREGYAVSFNGAIVMRSDTGQQLLYEGLPPDVAHDVMDWAQQRGAIIQTYHNDTIYITGENAHTHIDSSLTGMKQVVAEPGKLLDLQPIKYVFPGEPELLQQYQNELRAYLGERAGVFVSKPYFLEVMAPGADKGHGLAFLAERLGIDREQVMAVGDAANDLGMLRWAGTAVAMSNAVPEVLETADYVTERDNHHAGVAHILQQLVLI